MVLSMSRPIKGVCWAPETNHLAFCTGEKRMYLWSEDGASVCDVPVYYKRDFCVNKLSWSKDGNSILLTDKNEVVLVYPQFEYMEEAEEDKY